MVKEEFYNFPRNYAYGEVSSNDQFHTSPLEFLSSFGFSASELPFSNIPNVRAECLSSVWTSGNYDVSENNEAQLVTFLGET